MFGSAVRVTIAAAVVVLGAGAGWRAAPPSASADDGQAFSACMRSHGLPGFPDVAVSTDGLVNLDLRGDRVDVLSETYGEAVQACASLLPEGAGLPGAPTAPSAPAVLPAPGTPPVPPTP